MAGLDAAHVGPAVRYGWPRGDLFPSRGTKGLGHHHMRGLVTGARNSEPTCLSLLL